MKKLIVITLLIFLINPNLNSQNIDFRKKIQLKVKESFNYIYQQVETNSSDIVIIKTNSYPNYFYVVSVEDSIIKTKEVILPHHTKYKEDFVKIEQDSITDVFWIKKNRFQNLILKDFKNPFKISKRFQYEMISTIQKEINILEQQEIQYQKDLDAQSYYSMIKEKYSDLEWMNFETIQEGFTKSTNSNIKLSSSIIYPQMARETETQGVVRIGYVLTKDCQAEDFFVFKDLPYGCTEAVIKTIKEASNKLIEQNIICQKNYYIEGNFRFILF